MFGLAIVDIVVIVVYFLVVIAIGYWSMRRIKNQEDFFLGGRKFGKFIQTFAAFGQGTSADTAVGVTTTTYTNGAAGMWSSLIYLFATPVYWLVMPWMRRLRILTLGDFFEERYGSLKLAGIYAIIGTFGLMALLSVGFSAMSKTVVGLTPKPVTELTIEEQNEKILADEWLMLKQKPASTLSPEESETLQELNITKPASTFSYIDKNMLIWIICLLVIAYAIMGGLEAAFVTDTMQGIFIIILSIILIPFGIAKINAEYGSEGFMGAMKTLHENISASNFEIFGSPVTVDFTWYYILALSVMGLMNVVIQPNSLIAFGTGKDEFTCRFGAVTGSFMKRFVSVFWGFFAIMAILLYSGKVNDPDLVWGYATLDLLGSLKIGLLGLMISALLAALMSTADALMITVSSLLTKNLYAPIFPGKSEKHYIQIGRLMGTLFLMGSALIATRFNTILELLKLMWELNVMVAASFWLGMKWRKANAKAAWWSISFTSISFYLLPILVTTVFPSLRENQNLLKMTDPAPIIREYKATIADIEERPGLQAGDIFSKEYVLPPKSIYWTGGISKSEEGILEGGGLLNLELILLSKSGFKLENNPYALNETIRILIRTFIPFLVFILIVSLTRYQESERVNRFFMKMRTKVVTNHEEDERELALSYADTNRFKEKLVFPDSNWEFEKWDKTDLYGFLLSILGVLSVIGLMVLLTSIGS